MRGQLGYNTRPHTLLPHIFLGMDAWITTKSSFDSQATWVIDVLGLCIGMLSIGACTTMY